MDQKVELMNLFWSTAGIFPGQGEISPYDLKDRIESASKAGFKGIGIWITDLEHTLLKRPMSEIKNILEENDIKYVELEFLTDWFLKGTKKAESDKRKIKLFEASEALQAKHIKIGDFYSTECPMSQIVDSFALLCKEAKDYSATIGFEFMPNSMINNLADSLLMVKSADAQNGGIILDIVHVVNLGISNEEISKIPLQYLINVELNDGTIPESPTGERKFCGEGDYDIKGFIRCINEMGYQGPWGVEVFAKDLLELPLKELNRRAFNSTIAQFRN